MFRQYFIALICLLSLSSFIVKGQPALQDQKTITFGRPSITAVDWNPKQDLIAVTSAKEIWLYDAELKDVNHFVVELGFTEWNAIGVRQTFSDWHIEKVRWSPDGKLLTIGLAVDTTDGKRQPTIWQILNWNGNQFTRIMDQFQYVTEIKWSPDGFEYGLTSGDQIFLFDTGSNTPIGTFHAAELDWSSDSRHLAVVMSQEIQIVNSKTLQLEAIFTDSDVALRIALWSSDNTKIAAVGKNRLYVWDFAEKKTLVNLIHFFPNPYPEMGYGALREPIRGIVWRPNHDEITILYDGITTAQADRIAIWDVIANDETFSSVTGINIGEMQWTPEGHKLIFSGFTTFKMLSLLDVSSHNPPPQQDFSITQWSYSPFQNHLIGYNRFDSLFSQLDSDLFTTIKTFSGTASGIQTISWSHDKKHFVIASYDELQIWDISRGEKQYENTNHVGIWVNSTIWSDDANYVALVSSNPSSLFSHVCDSIRVWNTKTSVPFINLPVNIGTGISWVGKTNMLAISEPKSSVQNCKHPDQFSIVNVATNTVLLTLNHQQLIYLNWMNKVLNLSLQIIS